LAETLDVTNTFWLLGIAVLRIRTERWGITERSRGRRLLLLFGWCRPNRRCRSRQWNFLHDFDLEVGEFILLIVEYKKFAFSQCSK
jgi:hypothetical protein